MKHKINWFIAGVIIGSILCIGALVFSIIDAVLKENANFITIVSLSAASFASIISLILSLLATYFGDKSSKNTEKTLKSMEETFDKYIEYIKMKGLMLNQGNANDVVEASSSEGSDEISHTTPISD